MITNRFKRWAEIIRAKGLQYEAASRARKEVVTAPELLSIASEIEAFVDGLELAITLSDDTEEDDSP